MTEKLPIPSELEFDPRSLLNEGEEIIIGYGPYNTSQLSHIETGELNEAFGYGNWREIKDPIRQLIYIARIRQADSWGKRLGLPPADQTPIVIHPSDLDYK
jgi:hypothetical protein